MTVWPCDAPRPEASNLNFVAGAVVANGVIAPVGANGKVCVFTNVSSHLLVDIAGWFDGSGSVVGATPRRLLDTRNAIGAPKARLRAGGTITLPMVGAPMQRANGAPDTIPANATAVAINITAVAPSRPGYFTVWPCGSPRPEASNVNFTTGSVVANGVVASLGEGSICIFSDQESDVLVDVLGWFVPVGGIAPYVGAVPQRLVDTRNAIGGPTGVITPSTPRVRARSWRHLDGERCSSAGTGRRVGRCAEHHDGADAGRRIRHRLAVRHHMPGSVERQLRPGRHRRQRRDRARSAPTARSACTRAPTPT